MAHTGMIYDDDDDDDDDDDHDHDHDHVKKCLTS